MADSYFSDPSYSRPRAVDKAAGLSTTLGSLANLFNLSWVGQGASFVGGTFGSFITYIANGFSTPVAGPVQQTVSALGGWAAALVAAGPTIQALSEISRGNGRNAIAKLMNGAARVGVVMVQALFPGVAFVAEIGSLIFTGKFINTHLGEAAESLTASAIGTSKATPRTAPVIAQGAGMAPTLQPQMGMPMMAQAPMVAQVPMMTAPMMAQAPMMMPQQPVYYMPQMPQQPVAMMPPGMVQPQMTVPVSAVAPVPPSMMQPAQSVPAPANAQWTNIVSAQGHGPQGQGVRTLSVEPRTAQGFAQAEAARQAQASAQAPAVGGA